MAAARSEERTLIAVLLSYAERGEMFQDAKELFEVAFNQPKVQHRYLQAGPQAFMLNLEKANRELQTYLVEPLSLEFYPAEDPQAKCFLYWNEIELPIAKDQEVGELHLVGQDGKVLNRLPLLAQQEVGYSWPYNWLASLNSLHWVWKVVIVFFFLFLVWKFWR
jgi:D-alanyl-D-alanine carboxypeptidase (penicillin-binding protein 5/6)